MFLLKEYEKAIENKRANKGENKKVSKWMSIHISRHIYEWIFPQTCGICEKICEDAICSSCKKKLEKITFPHRKCFLEITGIYYDEHMHIFKYEGIIKEKLRQYKFKDQAYLCEFFAEIIYSNKKIMKYINNYD